MKPGTVVFLKSTEEPAFLLDIRKANDMQLYPGLSGSVAVIRRPKLGKEGITHSIEFFTVEEIESVEARQKRQISDMEELKAQYAQLQPTDAASTAGSN